MIESPDGHAVVIELRDGTVARHVDDPRVPGQDVAELQRLDVQEAVHHCEVEVVLLGHREAAIELVRHLLWGHDPGGAVSVARLRENRRR